MITYRKKALKTRVYSGFPGNIEQKDVVMKLSQKILSKFGLKLVKKNAVVLGKSELKALELLFRDCQYEISTGQRIIDNEFTGMGNIAINMGVKPLKNYSYYKILSLKLKRSNFAVTDSLAIGLENLAYYARNTTK